MGTTVLMGTTRMRQPLLVVTTLGLFVAQTTASQWNYNYTSSVTALREHLLVNSGYDKVVVPASNRTRGDHFQSGTDVAMQVRFFKVDFVDSGTGSMQIKIWLRLAWNDDRLAWDPDQWGGIRTIEVNSPELEETEIWVPDIVPYNARQTMSNSFEKSYAIVDFKGRVIWSRPGLLDVMCKFRGVRPLG